MILTMKNDAQALGKTRRASGIDAMAVRPFVHVVK